MITADHQQQQLQQQIKDVKLATEELRTAAVRGILDDDEDDDESANANSAARGGGSSAIGWLMLTVIFFAGAFAALYFLLDFAGANDAVFQHNWRIRTDGATKYVLQHRKWPFWVDFDDSAGSLPDALATMRYHIANATQKHAEKMRRWRTVTPQELQIAAGQLAQMQDDKASALTQWRIWSPFSITNARTTNVIIFLGTNAALAITTNMTSKLVCDDPDCWICRGTNAATVRPTRKGLYGETIL